jgi:hypothetical protein
MLKRYFTPPFEAAIAAGAPGVMVGAGSINGLPIHASDNLLQDLLRDTLNFTGIITRFVSLSLLLPLPLCSVLQFARTRTQ